MGCGSSSPPAAAAPPPPQVVPVTQGQMIQQVASAPYQPDGGKCKGQGKGKGKGKGSGKLKKWQIKLDGQWKDYDNQEDAILKRAFLVGKKKLSVPLARARL